MNIKIRLGLALGTLLLPAFAWAAAPGSVTGIHATLANGKVTVTWNAVTGQPISAYRVFFSHASILGNNGLYDDFETAAGSVTSYTIQNTPPVQTLFVSVLAVNDNGEESPYFAEEASVDMSGNASSAASQSSDNLLRLLSAQSISATGVLLTFSAPVNLDPSQALSSFTIQSASGTALAVTSVSSQGTTVTVTTAPQWSGAAYQVTVGGGITGNGPNNATLQYDASQGPVLFTGTPGTAVSESSSSAPQSQGSEVMNIMLRAKMEKTNLYTVEGSWTAPFGNMVASYQVQQSADGGITYGAPKMIDKNAAGISIAHVPAGTFTILVRTVETDGSMTQGASQTITLPTTKNTRPPSTGSKGGTSVGMEHVGTGGKLPQSGPTLWIAVAMAGAVAGYKVMKKKAVVA
jgi:hypothetical protein